MRRHGPGCASATAPAAAVTRGTPSAATAYCEACQWRRPGEVWTAGRTEDARLPAAAAAKDEIRIRNFANGLKKKKKKTPATIR